VMMMMMVVVMVMVVTTRQVVCAIGSRGLHTREHEPEGENEKGEGELHTSGDLGRNGSRCQALRKRAVTRRQ
jgi:hypothetical protein